MVIKKYSGTFHGFKLKRILMANTVTRRDGNEGKVQEFAIIIRVNSENSGMFYPNKVYSNQ